MNHGVLRKSFREAGPTAMIFAVALGAVECMFAYIIPTIVPEFADQMAQMPFVRDMIRGLLGAELSELAGPGTITALAWIHPITLTLIWAAQITIATRFPAGEIDQGTIDVVAALPVSRWSLYTSVTGITLATGLLLIGFAWMGFTVGGQLIAPDERPPARAIVIILGNLFMLYLCVSGLASLVSAVSSHRGRAVGVTLAFLIASFLVNFLAPFWPVADAISFLSLMDYYEPVEIIREAVWPFRDMLVLALAGVAMWLAGGIAFARRDICTV